MSKNNFAFPNLALSSHLRKNSTDEASPEPMPEDFEPTNAYVICGRGKKSYDHNEHFRQMVATFMDEYSAAPSKPEKSRIVTSVFEKIGAKGGFVRKDTKSERWVVVTEMAAREKISQAFRDGLTDQYQSSKDVRQLKRKQARAEIKCRAADDRDDANATTPPSAKRSRPTSPPTVLKTCDALRKLLQFSKTTARSNLSCPPTVDHNPSQMGPDVVPSVDPFASMDLRFHPVKQKRCSFTETSMKFDSEEFTPFPALSV